MGVILPETCEVECDACGCMEDNLYMTCYVGGGMVGGEMMGLDEYDLPEGWGEENGLLFCPDCLKEELKEETDEGN